MIVKRVLTGNAEYFDAPGLQGSSLDQVSPNVYSFRWRWYRNLVIKTPAGFVVVDPMNREAGQLLKTALADLWPGQKVVTLIYSHYHVDHASGGAALAPAEVIAHARCPQYWKDLGAAEVLTPTRLIEGDQTLTIGGTEIRLLYLPRSHTDTLYAVHVPSDRLLYTADMGMVHTIPPLGIPDHYSVGYVAALERLAGIDFDVFVPSHFGFGKKEHLVATLNMYKRSRELVRKLLAKDGLPQKEAFFADFFEEAYVPFQKEYGDWLGFGQQGAFLLMRQMEGELLGH
jgi:glyoxylase-like metal-dependent hydrolase (beta-lactamase superfamily II)